MAALTNARKAHRSCVLRSERMVEADRRGEAAKASMPQLTPEQRKDLYHTAAPAPQTHRGAATAMACADPPDQEPLEERGGTGKATLAHILLPLFVGRNAMPLAPGAPATRFHPRPVPALTASAPQAQTLPQETRSLYLQAGPTQQDTCA